MRLWDKAHALHRFWRYRLRTERDELAYLLGEDFTGATIVDVGAHRGAYTYWMHRAVGAAGRVVAFEPQPELVNYLGDLKQAFRLSRLDIVHSALSERPGELSLVRPQGHWGGASFHLEPAPAACDVLRVPVATLDDYLARRELPPVRFIKCDVQDHELHVMRGAARLLERHRPTLLVEQTEECFQSRELTNFLTGLGYAGFFFYRRELTPLDELPRLRRQIPAPFLNYIYRATNLRLRRASA